jgi:hypothetical protein
MNRFSPLLLAVTAAACASTAQPPVSAATPVGMPVPASALPTPEVGAMAPDFLFTPITSAGIATKSAKLSDYRGQTVVLWTFIRARTRG